MSLTSIRTYGWLTGSAKQVRNIGTYGWFAAAGPPPVFPTLIQSIFRMPIEALTYIQQYYAPPIDIQGQIILVNSEKSTPIERLAGLLVADQFPNSVISQLSKKKTIYIENKSSVSTLRSSLLENQLNLEKDNSFLTEYLSSLQQNNHLPVENRSESIIVTSPHAIPIGHLLYLDDPEKSIIEWGGTTIYVNSVKFIPVESLSNIFILPSLPIEEMDYPVIWYLDSRGVLWVLDQRTTSWIMDQRDNNWLIPEDLTHWILNYRSISWNITERD